MIEAARVQPYAPGTERPRSLDGIGQESAAEPSAGKSGHQSEVHDLDAPAIFASQLVIACQL
jgi:hypothetical protein